MMPSSLSTAAEYNRTDVIFDWLVHNAYRINLKGESMRKVNHTRLKRRGFKTIPIVVARCARAAYGIEYISL